jgi:tetratricopeptide (TPR) repeat protein
MFFRLASLISLMLSSLFAESLKVSSALFRTPEFRERFVGSYGFLPEVEPKVDQEEARFIAELAEILSAGRFKDAEKRLLSFIQERKSPVDAEVESKDVSAALIFTLGNLYYQNGRVPEAEKSYKIAIKRFPEYRRAHKNLALLYARSERLEEAKPHLMKALDLGDADHLSYGLLGHAMLHAEKALVAESAFRQAYLLNPDERDWKIGLVQALLLKEDWGQAASMMQTLIDESPDDAIFWMQQANCFIQSGEIMRAAENYEVLRLKGLADESALNQLGDIYANQEQALLALGAYLSAMRLSDEVKVARSLKAGQYLLQLGASREAARLMTELRTRAAGKLTKDEKVSAFLVESDIALAEQDLDAAGRLIKEALKVSPANGSARVKLGKILAERAAQTVEEAKITLLKMEARTQFLIAVDDRDVEVAYKANLGFAQLMVKDGQYLKALPRLEEAVRLKKGSKQSIEQYLRRVQRAAAREKATKEREDMERRARLEAAEKAQEAQEAEPEAGE